METIRLVPGGRWFRHASAAGSREPDGGPAGAAGLIAPAREQTSRRTEQGRVARSLAVTGGQYGAETYGALGVFVGRRPSDETLHGPAGDAGSWPL